MSKKVHPVRRTVPAALLEDNEVVLLLFLTWSV